MVERTILEGSVVSVLASGEHGAHIRGAGDDIEAGAEVVVAGTVLSPSHVAVLSNVRSEVLAVRAPVVGVLATGDELVEGDGPLRPGQIRESNRNALISLLSRDGYDPVDLGIAPDDESSIERRLRDAAEHCNAVVTTGGVSMGDFDLIKVVLGRLGGVRSMQVAIRPGKPFALGALGHVPVFGLAGNPVGSMVGYELLARPGLRKLAGRAEGDLRRRPIKGVTEVALRGAHYAATTFVLVNARFSDNGRLRVDAAPSQGFRRLHALAHSNALAIVGPGVMVDAGQEVDLLTLDS